MISSVLVLAAVGLLLSALFSGSMAPVACRQNVLPGAPIKAALLATTSRSPGSTALCDASHQT